MYISQSKQSEGSDAVEDAAVMTVNFDKLLDGIDNPVLLYPVPLRKSKLFPPVPAAAPSGHYRRKAGTVLHQPICILVFIAEKLKLNGLLQQLNLSV
jgi:hypothetical protein